MDAFALYTSNVFDYLTASVPVDHPSFTNRVDVEIDEKWAPFYEQTQLEFPTLKVKAPPPPRGKAASAPTGGKGTPHPAILTYGQKRAQYLKDHPQESVIATEEEMEAEYKRRSQMRRKESDLR